MAKEECCNCKQMLPVLLLIVLMLGGLYVVGTSVINQSVAPTENTNTISVSGDAKTTATPDETVIYFTIETLDDSSTVSQSENADIYDEVKKSLLALGVKTEDIETTNYYFELDKQGHWVCPDEKPDCNYNEEVYVEEVLGYKTTHSLSVTYKGTEKAGQLVDSIVSNGVEEIDYVYFQLSEETREELESQLLADAVGDAKEKAETIASAAGSTLGKLSSATYGQDYYPYYSYKSYDMAETASAGASTTLEPGTIEVSVSVSAVFEVK